MSHPGEWTFCIAEDEERSPWEPLHVERGMAAGTDAVTVFACEAPHSVAAVGSPQLMLNRIASKISARGSNNAEYRYGRGGELLVVINAEQARRLARDGWSKVDVKRWLWEHTTRKVREWLEDVDPYSPEIAGRLGLLARGEAWADWNDPDADVPVTPSPHDIHLVVAGGNSYFAAVLPGWGFLGGFAVTRAVAHPAELPGPGDGVAGRAAAVSRLPGRVYTPVPAETPAFRGDPRVGPVRAIGVLDDHLDPPFMDELVAHLRAQAPDVDVRVWTKPLGTAPAPVDVILEMAEEVRLALVGVGL
jgi:hypothetical protein